MIVYKFLRQAFAYKWIGKVCHKYLSMIQLIVSVICTIITLMEKVMSTGYFQLYCRKRCSDQMLSIMLVCFWYQEVRNRNRISIFLSQELPFWKKIFSCLLHLSNSQTIILQRCPPNWFNVCDNIILKNKMLTSPIPSIMVQ